MPGGWSSAESAWVRDHLERALAELGVQGEVRLRLVDDAHMTRAHVEHCGLDSTTDVLTFDLAGDSERTRVLDVDVLACVDEARRQGAARGHAAKAEILLYGLHAVLHCLGFDDHDDEAFERMHAEEDRVLGAIGVGAVFAREASGGEASP